MPATPLTVKLGQVVRELRKERGYSQEAFAHVCGIDRGYMGIIERGERAITVTMLEKVAKGLQISMTELVHRLEGNRLDASSAPADEAIN